MLKTRNLKPKNWSLFDIVGTYSSGTYSALKVGLVPEETTRIIKLQRHYKRTTLQNLWKIQTQ